MLHLVPVPFLHSTVHLNDEQQKRPKAEFSLRSKTAFQLKHLRDIGTSNTEVEGFFSYSGRAA